MHLPKSKRSQLRIGSGVTEQCGALSQSSGSGPLFFCNSRLQAKIPLNCVNFLHRYTTCKQHQLTSTKQLLKYKIRLNRRYLGSFIVSTRIIIEFILTIEFIIIKVGRRVLQGDCLSPLTINLCFNTFIRYVSDQKFKRFGFNTNSLLPIHWFQFADDAAAITGLEKENQIPLKSLYKMVYLGQHDY